MAHYLIVDDADVIRYKIEAVSIPEAVSAAGLSDPDADGISFDVYRIAGKAHRVTIKMETTRKVIVE